MLLIDDFDVYCVKTTGGNEEYVLGDPAEAEEKDRISRLVYYFEEDSPAEAEEEDRMSRLAYYFKENSPAEYIREGYVKTNKIESFWLSDKDVAVELVNNY